MKENIKIASGELDENGNLSFTGVVIYGGYGLSLDGVALVIREAIKEEFNEYPDNITTTIKDNPKHQLEIEFQASYNHYVIINPDTGVSKEGRFVDGVFIESNPNE